MIPTNGNRLLRLSWRDFEIPSSALASFERFERAERNGDESLDPAIGFVVRASRSETEGSDRRVRVRVRTVDGALLAARGFRAIARGPKTEDDSRALFERLSTEARSAARDLRGIARWRGSL